MYAQGISVRNLKTTFLFIKCIKNLWNEKKMSTFKKKIHNYYFSIKIIK